MGWSESKVFNGAIKIHVVSQYYMCPPLGYTVFVGSNFCMDIHEGSEVEWKKKVCGDQGMGSSITGWSDHPMIHGEWTLDLSEGST